MATDEEDVMLKEEVCMEWPLHPSWLLNDGKLIGFGQGSKESRIEYNIVLLIRVGK